MALSMVNFAQHSCGDSRLSCSECQSSICPKCMVECPVGNRCKKCAAKTESHVLKVTPIVAAKTLAVSGLAGCAFTFISPYTGSWFYSWIIVYFVGTLIGNVIHRISGYKLGPAIVSVVISGIAIGAFLNPMSMLRTTPIESKLDRLARMEMMREEYEEYPDPQMKNTDSSAELKLDPEALNKRKLKQRLAEERIEAIRNDSLKSIQFWQIINLLVFTVGVLTPFTGIVPPFPIFPYRR